MGLMDVCSRSEVRFVTLGGAFPQAKSTHPRFFPKTHQPTTPNHPATQNSPKINQKSLENFPAQPLVRQNSPNPPGGSAAPTQPATLETIPG